MMYKTLSQLAKAYKDGKLSKKSKLVVDDGKATVTAAPVDKKTLKPVKDAEAVVVFEMDTAQLLRDALKLSGVPTA